MRSIKRKDVAKTANTLKPFLKQSHWLGKKNQYSSNPTTKMEGEINAGALERPRQLSQYVVASGILHCADGWSYLGRAIIALMRGDPHRSLHLAYYAELRAAISLLASEGIGIFNRKHVVIDAPESVSVLEGWPGTHVMVWDCLQAWGDLQQSGDLFAGLITPAGRNLDDWLQPEGGSAAIAPQAKRWFLQWGMDLQMPLKDKHARNESSYRPDGLPRAWYIGVADSLSFIQHFWRALEPSAAATFENIDRNILRLTVESIYRGRHDEEPADNPNRFKAFVVRIVEQQAFLPKISEQWTDFLCRRVMPNDLPIFGHSKIAPSRESASHLAVISRATLLLRVATGSNVQLLKTAGHSGEDLDFWSSGIGHARGLWNDAPDSLLDLWADIPPLLKSIEDFQAAIAPDEQTFYRIGMELGSIFPGVGSCERITLWSLAAL